MAFSHNTLTQCTIRFRQMLTIFASNQGHHAFGENYEWAVVKKTERPSRLAHTKKWGNNSSTQPFRLNMTCFVVANCVEKFNNESRHVLLFQQRIQQIKQIRLYGTNERRRSTNQNVFGKATQHVYVSRFVSFAERLRSLSCLVYALHSLHLLHLLFHPSMKEP